MQRAREDIKRKYDADFSSSTYGKKLDMVLAYKDGEVDLSTIEWKKKKNVLARQLLFQEIKNVRMTKCNLSHILSLPLLEDDRADAYTIGMDRRGRSAFRRLQCGAKLRRSHCRLLKVHVHG